MSLGRLTRPAGWAAYASLVGAAAVAFVVSDSTSVREGLYLAIAYSAAAAVAAGVALYRPPGSAAWASAAVGITLMGTGRALLTVEGTSPGEGPLVSASNATYLAGYLAFAGAIVLLVRARGGDRILVRATLVDALAVATAALVLGWAFLADPLVHGASGDRAASIASLLLDVVLVAIAAQLVLRPGGADAARRLIAAGLVALFAGDVLWRRGVLLDSDPSGAWFEVLVPLAYACWGAAALHPSMRAVLAEEARPRETVTRPRLLLLALLTAVVPVVLVFGDFDLDRPGDLAVIALAATLLPLLVLARLALALGDLERLAEAARAGERRVRAVIEASPVPVALLDRARRVAMWNRAAARATGWEERELAGRRLPIWGAGREPLRRAEADVAAFGESRVELSWPARDRSPHDWDVSVGVVPGRGGEEAGLVAVALDVTERNRAAAALRESEERFRSLFETALDAIVVLDDERRCVDANPAACALFGVPRDELVGRVADDATLPGAGISELWRALLEQGALRGERDVELAHGRTATVEFTARASFVPGRHLFLLRDVSERRRQRERIEYVASHDALTDLPNRRAFEDVLAQAVKRARRGPPIGVMLADIDNFKLVNDTAGHPAGDSFLVAIADILRASLRPGDFLARLGGDEFAATVENVSEEEAKQIAERIVAEVGAFRFYEGGQVFDLGISVGLCLLDGGMKPPEAMAVADSALHVAKEQGKNRAVLWGAAKADLAELAVANSWIARIRQAIREDGLVLALQPVVDLATREPVHHEALVRMRGAAGELVPPNAFLPAAVRFGLMSEVDRWVIEHTLALLRADPGLRLFVNLAGSSLADDGLFQWIESTLRERRLEPERLGIEITEKAAFQDMTEAAKRLTSLRDLGCRLALDDFGVDFASFEPLRRLPLDFVKIGDTFVRDLLEDHADRAIVQAITTVSHALGKEVIVEGVQSDETAELARSFGIEYGQGYVFGPPDTRRFLELTRREGPALAGAP